MSESVGPSASAGVDRRRRSNEFRALRYYSRAPSMRARSVYIADRQRTYIVGINIILYYISHPAMIEKKFNG